MTSKSGEWGRKLPLALAFLALAAGPASAAEPTVEELSAVRPEAVPGLELVLTVVAKTGEAYEAGDGFDGARRVVPIIGGSFAGKDGLRGEVLPGGADRQRQRRDGVRELDAQYELRTEDGAVLLVRNQVLVDANAGPAGRYARSVVKITAPDGKYAWLNRRILVGTLTSLRPERPYVLLRFYAVN